jgi:hypothetical protein
MEVFAILIEFVLVSIRHSIYEAPETSTCEKGLTEHREVIP